MKQKKISFKTLSKKWTTKQTPTHLNDNHYSLCSCFLYLEFPFKRKKKITVNLMAECCFFFLLTWFFLIYLLFFLLLRLITKLRDTFSVSVVFFSSFDWISLNINININNNNKIKVDFLDTEGSMQFPAMRRLSIANANAFLLVYRFVLLFNLFI